MLKQASDFPILQNSQQPLGGGNGHQELILLGLERPLHEADRTLSSGADVRNEWVDTPLSLHTFS